MTPTVAELGAVLGRQVSSEQGLACLQILTAQASAFTRGQGFVAGVPCDEIKFGAILPAAVRLLSNPTGLLTDTVHGPDSQSFRSAFTGFSLSELSVLRRYRVLAL